MIEAYLELSTAGRTAALPAVERGASPVPVDIGPGPLARRKIGAAASGATSCGMELGFRRNGDVSQFHDTDPAPGTCGANATGSRAHDSEDVAIIQPRPPASDRYSGPDA